MKETNAEKFMRRCFVLAQQGEGLVSPNPLVGAVIVKNGQIIAEGYHACCGDLHAERAAIYQLVSKKGKLQNCAKGATLYVSLEPCSHHGKTPPCVDLIIEAGFAEVVFAVRDPNPLVRQRDPVKILKKAGIKVKYPFLEKEAREVNKVFFCNQEKKRPYFIWKAAMTIDGKIATASGESKWITSVVSREYVQRIRYSVDAILVGAGTIRADNPSLSVRLAGKNKNLKKIILGNPPKQAKVLRDENTLIFPEVIDFNKFAKELYAQGICSVLVEGGSKISALLLKANLIDEVQIFIAPKILGEKALSVVGDLGIERLKDAKLFKFTSVEKIGEDILIKGLF